MGSSAAQLQNGAFLAAPNNSAYDFGTGDFSLEAWINTRSSGTILSRKGFGGGGSNNGGYLLILQQSGALKFATDGGLGYYEIVTGAAGVQDGQWHHIAAVRTGATLRIYVDGGLVPSTPGGSATPPLDVNNDLRHLIGATDQQQEPFNRFTGLIAEARIWRRARSQGELLQRLYQPLRGDEAGLVGYWRLDGDGSDSSPTHNAAVAQGTVAYSSPGSPASTPAPTALSLTSQAFATAPSSGAYSVGTGDFTVQAWFRTTGTGTLISRKSTSGSSNHGGFLLVLKPNGVFKLATDSGSGFFEVNTATTNAADGAWHFVSATRQGGGFQVYLDGQLLGGSTGGNASPPLNVSNSERLVIGSTDQTQEPYRYFTGELGQIRVFNTARNQAQVIADMYTARNAREPGLVGAWPFSQGDAIDTSSTGNNASLTGAASFRSGGAALLLPAWPVTLLTPGNTAASSRSLPVSATTLWSGSAGEVRGGPVVDARGNIYLGDGNSKLYCFTSTGTLRWTYSGSYPFYATQCIGPDGTIYATSDRVVALTPDMSVLWTYQRAGIGMIVTQPAKLSPNADILYFLASSSTGQGDRLIALRTSNGGFLWEKTFSSGRCSATPGVGPDGTVYIGSEESVLYALNPRDGSLKWQYQAKASGDFSWIRGPTAVDSSGNVYFCRSGNPPGENKVFSLASGGVLRWSFGTGMYLANPPSVSVGPNGVVYAGFYGMVAITAQGQKLWESDTTGNVGIYPGAAAIDASGAVVFGAEGGLYAYTSQGAKIWQVTPGVSGSAPTLTEDGYILYANGSAPLVALRGPTTGITQAPVISQVSYDGAKVRASWSAVSQPGVTGYRIDVMQGGASIAHADVTSTSGEVTVPVAADKTYTVVVRATGNNIQGPDSAPVGVIVAAPTLSAVSYDGGKIRAAWSAVTGTAVTGYTLDILQGGVSVGHINTSGTSAELTLSLAADKTYTAVVRATGTRTRGPDSAPGGIIVAAPAGLRLVWTGAAFVATWSAVAEPAVTGYTAELRKDGAVVETKQPASPTATFDATLQIGASYAAVVRARGNGTLGPWSAPASGPSSRSVVYTHDDLGRLTTVSDANTTTTYTYDDLGNITDRATSARA